METEAVKTSSKPDVRRLRRFTWIVGIVTVVLYMIGSVPWLLLTFWPGTVKRLGQRYDGRIVYPFFVALVCFGIGLVIWLVSWLTLRKRTRQQA